MAICTNENGMKKNLSTALLFLSVLFPAIPFCQNSKSHLIDARASDETKALYDNLKELSKNHILFGHQHATQYGHGWSGDENRSDVKSVTGSHPAVIGIDFSGLSGRPDSMIEKE